MRGAPQKQTAQALQRYASCPKGNDISRVDMKINLKEFFGFNWFSEVKSNVDKEALEYDKNVDFYYSNLINSIILFSLPKVELENLSDASFNPIFELESEIDYAYTPVCFETIFRNNLIDPKFKNELLNFKKEVDDIPKEIWDWDLIDNHNVWIVIRGKANDILNKLGITSRTYNDDYTTIIDKSGKTQKKGKSF